MGVSQDSRTAPTELGLSNRSPDEVAFRAMFTEWQAMGIPDVPDVDAWEATLAAMQEEMLQLRSRGMWRTGGLTLLRQLGLHQNEVMLCRGLGWLLTPDGWHGLGDAFLRSFASALGLPTDSVDQATVSLEETRGVTRADVVVRYPGACVLVEAKVLAGEQPGQADRLAWEWADENPRLVFLTRQGREPLTAEATSGQWSCLRWSHLAMMAWDLAQEEANVSAGALELIETWKNYGG